MRKLLYATSNPGKTEELRGLSSTRNINLYTPHDIGIDLDPEESGSSLEENAIIKCTAYLHEIDKDEFLVMADDTGVEITALNNEPGIHVRRWKGYRMSDEEIIDYCLERMKEIPSGNRQASFRTVLAIGSKSITLNLFEGRLEGEIVQEPIKLRMKGFPFESIFYSTEYNMMLGDMHTLSQSEKIEKNILSHREKALINALPFIESYLKEDSRSS